MEVVKTNEFDEGIGLNIDIKNKIGGTVIGRVYVSKRKPNHVMRMFGGSLGISRDILNKLKRWGVEYIMFLYFGKREKQTFITTVKHYLENPIGTYMYKGVDKQNHVRIRDMEKIYNTVEGWRYKVKVLNNIGIGGL